MYNAGIAYSPASATFGIIPTHLEMRDVCCLVSPSRAFWFSRFQVVVFFSSHTQLYRI